MTPEIFLIVESTGFEKRYFHAAPPMNEAGHFDEISRLNVGLSSSKIYYALLDSKGQQIQPRQKIPDPTFEQVMGTCPNCGESVNGGKCENCGTVI